MTSFKLNKEQLATRDFILERLRAIADSLEGRISAFNDALALHREQVDGALGAYNEVLEQAREFASGVASDADEDICEKSEKWQEGDRGQAASAWRNEWDSIDLDDYEIELPDDVEFDPPSHADTLENVPEQLEAWR